MLANVCSTSNVKIEELRHTVISGYCSDRRLSGLSVSVLNSYLI